MKNQFVRLNKNNVLVTTIALVICVSFLMFSATQSAALSQPTPVTLPPPIQATCVIRYIDQNRWAVSTNTMPTPRSEMAAAAVGDLIYVPGGFGGTDAFEEFNVYLETWKKLSPLPEGRNHLMVAALDDYVYVFGGGRNDSSGATDTAWKYDRKKDAWSVVAPMPEPRYAGAAVSFGNYLFVLGGTGGSKALLRYDPATDSWTKRADLRESREHLAAAVLDGKIYALAGRWSGEVFNTVEVYDPVTDTWVFGDPMQEMRSGFGATVIGEHIFVAGGEVFAEGAKALYSVEAYHPTLRQWKYMPSLPFAIHGNPLVGVRQTLYVLGGSDRAAGIDNKGRVMIYRIPQ